MNNQPNQPDRAAIEAEKAEIIGGVLDLVLICPHCGKGSPRTVDYRIVSIVGAQCDYCELYFDAVVQNVFDAGHQSAVRPVDGEVATEDASLTITSDANQIFAGAAAFKRDFHRLTGDKTNDFIVGFNAGFIAQAEHNDPWIAITDESSLPPPKDGFEHTEQHLVWYPGGERAAATFGIAYYHYNSPYEGSKWIDWQHLGRAPSHYQKIAAPQQGGE